MKSQKIKFSASQVGKLLIDPRSKADKEAGELSETAKSYVESVWLEKKHGYKDVVVTDIILKGHLCEQDGFALVSEVHPTKEFRVKNTKRFDNDFFTGHPDCILSDVVEDVKCPWTIKTFFEKKELEKLYEVQGQVYMDLTGARKFRVLYCGITTPDRLVENEVRKYFYKYGGDENNVHFLEAEKQIRKNHNFDNIPLNDRVKCFAFDFDEALIGRLKMKVEKARDYYNTLTL